MKLKDLKDKVDFLMTTGHEEDDVVVTLKESSVAVRAFANVDSIYAGFDWESGQIRIETDKEIISYNLRRDAKMLPFRVGTMVGTRKKYILKCPKCEEHLRKTDRYCPTCGQAIETEGFREVSN